MISDPDGDSTGDKMRALATHALPPDDNPARGHHNASVAMHLSSMVADVTARNTNLAATSIGDLAAPVETVPRPRPTGFDPALHTEPPPEVTGSPQLSDPKPPPTGEIGGPAGRAALAFGG